jgi:prepilin-type processing-associated H-X9-DG protein
MDSGREMTGGLRIEDDYFFEQPSDCAWVREATSFWIFDDEGRFGIPRSGVEAEPVSWENRRYQANFAFADGRVLSDMGVGAMHSVLDESGQPAVLGAGPLTYRCVEPFRRWQVGFDGEVSDTSIGNQLAGQVQGFPRIPLRYEIELEMVVPAYIQDNSPEAFFKRGKGEQRDGLSVGLGWRIEQLFKGSGWFEVDGRRRDFSASGMRVKRRSVRTDGLFLRGHCWQTAVFPDGRAFGYLAYPPHDDGFEPWNEGFIWQDGRMYPAKAKEMPWLRRFGASGDDVSVELHSELGVTRIEGTTTLSTCRISSKEMWGLDLQQSGVHYSWDGQTAYGMIERSARPEQTTVVV